MSERKMNDKIKQLCAPLGLDAIELRIGAQGVGRGFQLLAYKNSRVDVERLNEVFGIQWKNDFDFDEKGNLRCTIYVWDSEIKEWVYRKDVGTESTYEKEKGLHSDAFKRAGFRWGIGIELYRCPFIWIQWDKWIQTKNSKGKMTDAPSCARDIKNWSIEGAFPDGEFSIIDNKGVTVWNSKKFTKYIPEKTESAEDEKAKVKALIDEAKSLIVEKDTVIEKVMEHYNSKYPGKGMKGIDDLELVMLKDLVKTLRDKKAGAK